ncbi:P protein isoform X2 [Drosophila takahashii]|uniref:P protein isoform X2 n=1 Tax=Drosophila takahashii TaxID=29030 RepID=UPI0038993861
MNPLHYSRKRYRRSGPQTTRGYVFLIIKVSILVALWSGFTLVLLSHKSDGVTKTMVTVMPNKTVLRDVKMKEKPVQIILEGAIWSYPTNKFRKAHKFPAVAVRLEWRDGNMNFSYRRTGKWMVYLAKDKTKMEPVRKIFKFHPLLWSNENESIMTKHISKNVSDDPMPKWSYAKTVISLESMRDRTLCTLLTTCAALATLTVVGNRPSFKQIMSWVDFETLMLLLGNMVMMSLMAETGFFDYLAVVAYRISKGHAWLLIALLGVVVSLCSAFLDNATVVLLFSPAVVRLCEAMAVRTTLVLVIIALYANIGGSVTPVGGPPNAIIANNPSVASAIDISFIRFSLRMLPAAVICMIAVFGIFYMTMKERIFMLDQNQIELDQKRRDEIRPRFDIQLRIAELRRNQPRRPWLQPAFNYFETLATLEASNRIRKKMLLVQSLMALGFAASCFILTSVPSAIPGASLGWISILSAFLLLIMADKKDMGETLGRVEWGVMLYLASFFVLTEVLVQLGLIHWLGQKAVKVMKTVDCPYQTMIGMLLILWISALMSSVIDNAAVATIMVRLCIDMAFDDGVNVKIMPLVWATCFGTSYGANGTLLGSCANEFAAVVARAYGYEISFRAFFRVGFPIMLLTIVICTLFLMIADSVLSWQ